MDHERSEKYGMRVSEKVWDVCALADENGPIYDSRHGLAGYYRYHPRRIENHEHRGSHREALQDPRERAPAHQTGQTLCALRAAPGSTVMGSTVRLRGAKYLQTDIGDGSPWMKQRERVWNWVWWRRSPISAPCSRRWLCSHALMN